MVALGIVLVVAAVALIVIEAHVPTGGVIAGGAVLAVVAGIVLLLAAAGAGLAAILAVALIVCLGAGAGLLIAGRTIMRARRVRPRSGPEALVGHVGIVRGAPDHVFVDGALWRAKHDALEEPATLHEGDRVVVQRVRGLTLCVRKAEEWELEPWS
jgi:membrane-bound serine protease (ClpP class)